MGSANLDIDVSSDRPYVSGSATAGLPEFSALDGLVKTSVKASADIAVGFGGSFTVSLGDGGRFRFAAASVSPTKGMWPAFISARPSRNNRSADGSALASPVATVITAMAAVNQQGPRRTPHRRRPEMRVR